MPGTCNWMPLDMFFTKCNRGSFNWYCFPDQWEIDWASLGTQSAFPDNRKVFIFIVTNFDFHHHQIGEDINVEERRHRHNLQEWLGPLRQPHKTNSWSDNDLSETLSEKNVKKVTSGTCFMSFTNYPMDEQLCRVLSVSHSNSIHEVETWQIVSISFDVLGRAARFDIVQHRVPTAPTVQAWAKAPTRQLHFHGFGGRHVLRPGIHENFDSVL